jgi:hypothetical protein
LLKSGEEFQNMLDDIQMVTNRDENFILSNDKENGIIIFGCKTNLKMLSTAESIYTDGTFFNIVLNFFCNYLLYMVISMAIIYL